MIGALALAGVIAFTQGPGIATVRPGAPPHRVVEVGWAPAWSPDGRRLAVVVRGGVWAMDADGSHERELVADGTAPAWSPDGRRLAFVRGGGVWTVGADGDGMHVFAAAGSDPTWSPDGTRLAYALDGELYAKSVTGGRAVRLTGGEDASQPAWSPDGRRIAYVSDLTGDSEIHVLDVKTRRRSRVTWNAAADTRPAWSPDGRRLVWERDGAIWVGAADGTGERRLATGADPSWQPLPRRTALLPDLKQRPPAHLEIQREHGRWQLGFDTAVDNVGDGPFVVVAHRPTGAGNMRAAQRVQLAGGSTRVYPQVGVLHYEAAGQHFHWHFQPYELYQLRRADGSVVVHDHKQGFCLADHYGQAPGELAHRVPHPVFLGDCDRSDPAASHLVEGSSVGYTDRYPAFYEGQSLDLTGVPAGRYTVVNRVNPYLRFRELRYDDDAASVAVRISWPHGRGQAPAVQVLRRCLRETC